MKEIKEDVERWRAEGKKVGDRHRRCHPPFGATTDRREARDLGDRRALRLRVGRLRGVGRLRERA